MCSRRGRSGRRRANTVDTTPTTHGEDEHRPERGGDRGRVDGLAGQPGVEHAAEDRDAHRVAQRSEEQGRRRGDAEVARAHAVLGREQRRLHAATRADAEEQRRQGDEEQRRAAVQRRQQEHGDGHEHTARDRPGAVPARAGDQATGDEGAEGRAEHERHEDQP